MRNAGAGAYRAGMGATVEHGKVVLRASDFRPHADFTLDLVDVVPDQILAFLDHLARRTRHRDGVADRPFVDDLRLAVGRLDDEKGNLLSVVGKQNAEVLDVKVVGRNRALHLSRRELEGLREARAVVVDRCVVRDLADVKAVGRFAALLSAGRLGALHGVLEAVPGSLRLEAEDRRLFCSRENRLNLGGIDHLGLRVLLLGAQRLHQALSQGALDLVEGEGRRLGGERDEVELAQLLGAVARVVVDVAVLGNEHSGPLPREHPHGDAAAVGLLLEGVRRIDEAKDPVLTDEDRAQKVEALAMATFTRKGNKTGGLPELQIALVRIAGAWFVRVSP